MDKKLERYYHHIMDDLLSKTNMEYNSYNFSPFWQEGHSRSETLNGIIRNSSGDAHYISKFPEAIKYLRENYGVRDEDMEYLWDWYVWNIKSTITGRYE